MSEKELKVRLKRLETVNFVSFSHYAPEGHIDLETAGRTLDLSEGGILIEIPNPLPSTATEVELRLGIQENIVTVRGAILHQRELDNGHFGLGIRFDEITDEDLSVITAFLAEED
ncbi:MAG: PilZ domain-containing protein [bacterium]